MSCSLEQLKDYALGELSRTEAKQVEAHAAACAGCREELDRLALTRTALFSLQDEEPARRIAFVSDKVIAPPWWRRWWLSGPQVGFASAAMLSAALVTSAFVFAGQGRQSDGTVAVTPAPSAPGVTMEQVQTLVDREVERRLHAAVAQVATESRAVQDRRIAGLVAAKLRESDRRQHTDLTALKVAVDENIQVFQKELRMLYPRASNASLEVGQ